MDVREPSEVHQEERDEKSLAEPVDRLARLREQQLGHVEATDDHVLEPVEQHQGKHRPAEEQHAGEWQRVRDDEGDQGWRHGETICEKPLG